MRYDNKYTILSREIQGSPYSGLNEQEKRLKHLKKDGSWDKVYRELPLKDIPWEILRPDPPLKKLVDSGVFKKGKVLDACSGAGTQSIYLAKKGFKVTGIEISQEAVKIAKRRAKKAGVTCAFLNRDVLDFPFKKNEFDSIIDRGCFHHIPKYKRQDYLKGAHRVLKENGKYYLKCFSYKNGKSWNYFTKKELIKYLTPYFKILELEHIDRGADRPKGRRYFWYAFLERRSDSNLKNP